MNTSTLRLTGLSALSLAAGACTDGSVQNDPRPNIVLFLADDIGAECFGCMGGVSYDTHTIDSLARNGTMLGRGSFCTDPSVQAPQLRLLRLYE